MYLQVNLVVLLNKNAELTRINSNIEILKSNLYLFNKIKLSIKGSK